MAKETPYTLQVEAINGRIRIDYGKIYYEHNTKHGEPANCPYTSILYKRIIEEGAELVEQEGFFTLFEGKSRTKILAKANTFVGILGNLADYEYRKDKQNKYEDVLPEELNFISKGDPEKGTGPFILSQVV